MDVINSYEIKIVIVVVLFNEQAPTYINKNLNFEIVLVDNTPERDLKICLPHVTYIPLYKNYGIAKALNIGFSYAERIGAEWVLTMDQDSELPDNIFSEYRNYITILDTPAILAPQLLMFDGEVKRVSNSFELMKEALTSGSLVSMKAFKESGGFKEFLFIDGVDFEFCKHVRLLGYNVYQINSVVMQHHLGKTKEIKLLGKHLFYVTHHGYIRHYYMQRNSLWIANHYKGLLPENKSVHYLPLKSIFKILFFEKDKLRKLKARYKGYCDYKHNRFGEFVEL